MFQCVYEVKPHSRTIKIKRNEYSNFIYKDYVKLNYTQFWFYCNNRLHVTSSKVSVLHEDYVACHSELPNTDKYGVVCQPIFSSHKRAIDFYWSSTFHGYGGYEDFCICKRMQIPYFYRKSLYRKIPSGLTIFQMMRTHLLKWVK